MKKQIYTSIDLFSGAGGFTEGLRKAGIKAALANDFDEMAATTFKFNHENVPFVLGDVSNLSSNEILDKTGLKRGEISIVCGGPPCQGFSLAGQRLNNDPRNQLFKEFVRIVRGLEPKIFVFENVSGITSMEKGGVLKAIVKEFAAIGYNCEFKILNSADYGVPQARPRFILIGSRDQLQIGFPEPLFFDVGSNQKDMFMSNDFKHRTVWEALSDLPEIQQGEGEEQLSHSGKYYNDYQKERRGQRRPGIIFNHRATRHSEKIIQRYSLIPEGEDNSKVPEEFRTKKINVFKLHRNKPSRTVTCNHRTDLLHPVIPRGITVREAARLQSFDDDYQFFGNLTRKARWITQDDQVGNAVPPLLAYAIGKHIIDAIRS